MLKKTTYYVLKEPLLLQAEGDAKSFHMLPAGTPQYEDWSAPEGFTRYRVYINIKGDPSMDKIVSDKINLIDPIWAQQIYPNDLPKLMADTPVTKDDLIRILKARKVTREDLAQIVREWTD